MDNKILSFSVQKLFLLGKQEIGMKTKGESPALFIIEFGKFRPTIEWVSCLWDVKIVY